MGKGNVLVVHDRGGLGKCKVRTLDSREGLGAGKGN